MKTDHHKIESLITPIVNAMGYDVWSIELRKSRRNTLVRIYVDMPVGDERKSVSVDDCSQVSKQIDALFDVENPILESYILEVSSPGLNRSLSKLEHYQRYIGSVVHIVLRQPEDGKYDFTGKIQEVFGDTLKLVINNEVVTFLLTNIYKANLVPCF
ncbi:MAG: hypothetical protein A2V89_05400 [Gammaproteobacteria bacterium RBG_16_37_9]|nr:MAG: hypothetical protein A2V89_05400 [Gammaproteobacteria bacterium RBG_16_37_9]